MQTYTNLGGGKWAGKIGVAKSGLFLPVELTRGETARTFDQGATVALQEILTKLAGEWSKGL